MKNRHWASLVVLMLLSPLAVFADVFSAIQEGKTDEVIALYAKNPEILIQRDAKFGAQPLTWACLHRNRRLAIFLISKGATIEDRNTNADTPLLVAATTGDKEIVQLLLDSGAKVNVQNKTSGTPLTSSMLLGQSDVAMLLLQKGASITVTNHAGQTPIHVASLAGLPMVVKQLIVKGANVNVQDKNGHTPLMYSAAIGSTLVVEQLLAAGADPDIAAPDGSTARKVAESKGKDRVLAILNRTKGAWSKPVSHHYEGVGTVNAGLNVSGSTNVIPGKIEVFIDNSHRLVLMGRGLGHQTIKTFSISEAVPMAAAVQKAFAWGRQAKEDRVAGNKRLYEDNVGRPKFIIGFSAEERGQQWHVYLVFTESLDEGYVFALGTEETKQLCDLLRKAPGQQQETKTNDRNMSNFK